MMLDADGSAGVRQGAKNCAQFGGDPSSRMVTKEDGDQKKLWRTKRPTCIYPCHRSSIVRCTRAKASPIELRGITQ